MLPRHVRRLGPVVTAAATLLGILVGTVGTADAAPTPDHYNSLVTFTATETLRHGPDSYGESETFTFGGTYQLDPSNGYYRIFNRTSDCFGSWGGVSDFIKMDIKRPDPSSTQVDIGLSDELLTGFFHCATWGVPEHEGATHASLSLPGNSARTMTTFYESPRSQNRATVVWTFHNTVVADNTIPPVSGADSYTVLQGGELNVPAASGLLANDADPNGNPLTVLNTSRAQHGTVFTQSDGRVYYKPDADFTGVDTFTYQAFNGTVLGPVTAARISVNRKPTPRANSEEYTVPNGQLHVSAPGVLNNDVSPAGTPLEALLITKAQHGALTLNGNGSFDYTAVAGYVGPDSFTYQAYDHTGIDGFTAPATVTLNVLPVNHAPVATADSYAVAHNTRLTVAAPGVLANDTDADKDKLSAVLATGPAHGTLHLNANGSFDYTPASGYKGPDSFTYKPSDGTLSGAARTVTLSVA